MQKLQIVLVGLAVGFIGCSSDSSPSQDGAVQDSAAADAQPLADTTPTPAPDVTAPDVGVDATPEGDGKATTIEFHLHDNEVTLVLSTMTVGGKEATGWDLYMAHDDGPNMYLGEGVTAQNLGAEKGFHEVDEAPEDSYQPDGDTLDSLVIGTSWRSGGTGTTGYIMTDNVYVLKLADGTYAKVQVLSAKAGTIPVRCYRQPSGSRNLETTE